MTASQKRWQKDM